MMKREPEELYPLIQTLITQKEQRAAELEQAMERYEKKRMMEEKAYQAMSPLRRLLSAKKPNHHLAVEYIHYVKKPLEQIRQLRTEIERAKALLQQVKSRNPHDVTDQIEKLLSRIE